MKVLTAPLAVLLFIVSTDAFLESIFGGGDGKYIVDNEKICHG